MPQWEYHVENLFIKRGPLRRRKQDDELEDFSDRLTEIGADGWELAFYGPIGSSIQGTQNRTSYVAIFKRPLS